MPALIIAFGLSLSGLLLWNGRRDAIDIARQMRVAWPRMKGRRLAHLAWLVNNQP